MRSVTIVSLPVKGRERLAMISSMSFIFLRFILSVSVRGGGEICCVASLETNT